MANDRMYLVNVTEGTYICIAKAYGIWGLGNVELLYKFLGDSTEWDEIVIKKESDEDTSFMGNMINFNESNRWDYYEPKSDKDETY